MLMTNMKANVFIVNGEEGEAEGSSRINRLNS